MSDPNNLLSIDILDKQYRISCPDGEQEILLESAQLLEKRMRDIRDKGKLIGLERIAIMAALNIARELVETQQKLDATTQYSKEQLLRLMSKVDDALKDTQK